MIEELLELYFEMYRSNQLKPVINNKLPIMDNKMYDEKIFKIICKDKKNIDGKINFVLLKSIGSAFLKNNINLNNIKKLIK